MGPHKFFFFFEILSFRFCTIVSPVFLFNMGSYGSDNFKTLFLLQIPFELFQTCPEFFLDGPHISTVFDFFL